MMGITSTVTTVLLLLLLVQGSRGKNSVGLVLGVPWMRSVLVAVVAVVTVMVVAAPPAAATAAACRERANAVGCEAATVECCRGKPLAACPIVLHKHVLLRLWRCAAVLWRRLVRCRRHERTAVSHTAAAAAAASSAAAAKGVGRCVECAVAPLFVEDTGLAATLAAQDLHPIRGGDKGMAGEGRNERG